VQVRLPDKHDAGAAQMRGDRRVALSRRVSGAHAGRGGGRRPAHVDQILDRHRHAVQRSAIVSGGDLAIGFARLPSGLAGHDEDERIQPRIIGLDPRQARVGRFERARLARAKLPSKVLDGQRGHHCSWWLVASGWWLMVSDWDLR